MYKIPFIILSLIPLYTSTTPAVTPHVINVAKAAPIILATHIAADTVSTFNHEIGHGIAGYALTHASFKNYFYWADSTLKFLFFPLAGSSHSKFDQPLSDNQVIAHIAAGPLAGISTTYGQVVALETFKTYLETNKISLNSGICRPFTFYKDMSELITNIVWSFRNVKRFDTKSLALSSIILNGIQFMRLSRISGEIAYGLLPTVDSISINNSNNYKGDGLNLWETIYKKYNIENGPKIKGNLFLLATIPTILACMHGLAKGLLTNPS